PFQLGPETLDGDVYQARVADGRVPPHVLQQDLPGEHPPGPARQFAEEAELGGGEVDLVAAACDPVGGDVDSHIAHAQLVAHVGPVRPAQYGAETGHQDRHLERLRHVVVGSQLQAEDHVGGGVAGGEHQHGDARGVADRPQDLEAVAAGEHHVEHDRVRGVPAE